MQMAESREQFLARVAEAHDEWEREHVDSVTYDPDARPDSGDANLWYVDTDADGSLQDELFDKIGPERPTQGGEVSDDEDG